MPAPFTSQPAQPQNASGTPALRPLASWVRFLPSILIFLVALLTHAEEVTLAWDPNQEEDLEGYRLHYGYQSRTYSVSVDVGNVTTFPVDLPPVGGETHYFAVTAYNTNKLESDYSNEVSHLAAVEPGTIVETNVFTLFTDEDHPVTITWNSAVLDLQTAVVYIAEPPALGLILGATTNLVYEPRPDLNGVDHCRLILTDTNRNVLKLEFSIEINPVNDRPIAYASYEWADSTSPIPIFLGAYDPDGDALTYALLDGPSHGGLEGEPPQLTYSPNIDYVGVDYLTFQVSDGEFESDTATVSIQIEIINGPPVAGDLELSTDEDQPLNISLPVFDPDGDSMYISILEGPSAGTLSGVPPNLIYTPRPEFSGNDWFTYIAEDEQSSSTLAYVGITIPSVNDPPNAEPMTFRIHEDTTLELQLNATDPDDNDDTLVFQVVSPPAHGKLTGQLPHLLYAPSTNYWGPDAFTFRVTDNQRASDTAQISITVLPINDQPAAEFRVEETTQAVPINIVLSGFDPDGDELAYEIVVPPAHGRLSGDPPNLVYSPYVTFSGSDQFTYSGFDGIEESNPALVTLNVLPLQDPTLLAPRIIEMELVGDTARLTWSSWPGGIYRILGKHNFDTPEWEPATEEFVAFEQTSTALIPIVSEAAGRIYSVELVR